MTNLTAELETDAKRFLTSVNRTACRENFLTSLRVSMLAVSIEPFGLWAKTLRGQVYTRQNLDLAKGGPQVVSVGVIKCPQVVSIGVINFLYGDWSMMT